MKMFQKLWQVLVIFILCAHKVWSQHNNMCSVAFEAENGSGGKEEYRSNASGGISVKLTEGDTISYQVDFAYNNNVCTVQLLSVTYSNDGFMDSIQVSLDGILLGSFQTYASSSGGENWNTFRTQRGFVSKVQLHDSQFVITVDALNTDEYGVEIDKISLQLDCTSEVTVEDAQCSHSIVSVDGKASSNDGNSRLSDELIATIFFGILGSLLALLGIPGCIIASRQLRKRNTNQTVTM